MKNVFYNTSDDTFETDIKKTDSNDFYKNDFSEYE